MSVHPARPPFIEIPNRRIFMLVVFLRACFMCTLLVLINHLIPLGTSLRLLMPAVGCGVIVGSVLAFSTLRTRGFLSLLLAAYLIFHLLRIFAAWIPFASPELVLRPFVIFEHLGLALFAFGFATALSWIFWRHRQASTLEILCLGALAVTLLAGHRNYNFQNPQLLSSLAWDFGLQPLTALVAAGLIILAFVPGYLLAISPPGRPQQLPVGRARWRTLLSSRDLRAVWRTPADNTVIRVGDQVQRGRPAWPWVIALLILVFGGIAGISRGVFLYYSREALSRTANGVGQEKGEGLSPLTFHSALGSSNQPAAVVRLEGDYRENPYSPMLYLREGALSEFAGNEMTQAAREFDQDVSGIDPGSNYQGTEDATLLQRVPVVQSVYLLTEHKTAFTLDYPLSINQLKLPEDKRFRAGYRAYSIAPGWVLDSIADLETGDPRWSQQVREHYLKPHPDPRYRELAEKIVRDAPSNVQKSGAISEYLSKNATYTLTPNHDVKDGEDPVVPFLFGDMRGYCVHFAHATVYMLRALGIPARIGTGYLTDLSQSKDGHILLRMSDRHAWAEVYVAGRGWLPFDTQPEKVESHADTQIDMKLLEELMGILGPGEEILPNKTIEAEAGIEPPSVSYLPDRSLIYMLAALLLILLSVAKLYMRYGWALTSDPRTRLRRSYASIVSLLCDLGLERRFGETREEFRERASRRFGPDLLRLTALVNALKYAPGGVTTVDRRAVDALRSADRKLVRRTAKWRHALGWFNPASLVLIFSRSRW